MNITRLLAAMICVFTVSASGSADSAACRPSPDLTSLAADADRVAGRLVLAPMRCANAQAGIYCTADVDSVSVTVVGAHLGATTSPAAASRVRGCGVGVSDCVFVVDVDPETLRAARRSDVPGWRIIEISGSRIDLGPLSCP